MIPYWQICWHTLAREKAVRQEQWAISQTPYQPRALGRFLDRWRNIADIKDIASDGQEHCHVGAVLEEQILVLQRLQPGNSALP